MADYDPTRADTPSECPGVSPTAREEPTCGQPQAQEILESNGGSQTLPTHGAANGRLIELITRALPWPSNGEDGHVNLFWYREGTFLRGQTVHSIDEFQEAVGRAQGSSAYLSLSTLKGENALALKSLWLPIPIKPEAH